jgi:hypothetical protein
MFLCLNLFIKNKKRMKETLLEICNKLQKNSGLDLTEILKKLYFLDLIPRGITEDKFIDGLKVNSFYQKYINPRKNATTQDIEMAANWIMDTACHVTSLEVKTHLRLNNFWVTQSEVSKVLNSSTFDKWNVETVDNDTDHAHQLYTIKTVVTTSNPLNISKFTPSNPLTAGAGVNRVNTSRSYTKRDGTTITEIDIVGPDDWAVSFSGSNAYHYFDGKHTRDDVRLALSRIKNLDIVDVRARRYQNL